MPSGTGSLRVEDEQEKEERVPLMIGRFTPGQLHEKLELKEVDLRFIIASKIRNANDGKKMQENDATVAEKLERNLGKLREIQPLLGEV